MKCFSWRESEQSKCGEPPVNAKCIQKAFEILIFFPNEKYLEFISNVILSSSTWE